MYERMLDKTKEPALAEMTAYCGKTAGLFTGLNDWLSVEYATESKVVFPYGKSYGWGVAHTKKKKLICNVFAEKNAFTVMLRLTNEQFDAVYGKVQSYAQEYIDNKYPCGQGGWIHYRITCPEQFDDVKKLLSVKCDKK